MHLGMVLVSNNAISQKNFKNQVLHHPSMKNWIRDFHISIYSTSIGFYDFSFFHVFNTKNQVQYTIWIYVWKDLVFSHDPGYSKVKSDQTKPQQMIEARLRKTQLIMNPTYNEPN